jgi:hypothetical protein
MKMLRGEVKSAKEDNEILEKEFLLLKEKSKRNED